MTRRPYCSDECRGWTRLRAQRAAAGDPRTLGRYERDTRANFDELEAVLADQIPNGNPNPAISVAARNYGLSVAKRHRWVRQRRLIDGVCVGCELPLAAEAAR